MTPVCNFIRQSVPVGEERRLSELSSSTLALVTPPIPKQPITLVLREAKGGVNFLAGFSQSPRKEIRCFLFNEWSEQMTGWWFVLQ